MIAKLAPRSLGYANVYAPDPDARVQTGPGRPDWSWQRVSLAWSGPVERDQEIGLWLLPPWLNGALAVLRVALLAALVLLLLGRLPRRAGAGARRRCIGSAVALALALGLAPAPARAELPTPELLEELRERLLERPSCAPSCATASRLALSVAPERLELRLGVDVAAESAVPLPERRHAATRAGFTPDTIAVDGRPAEAVRRDAAGQLWLRLAPGSHVIGLAGPLPARANVEIPLPLRPQRVELIGAPRGWTVLGLDAAGRVSGALQLARDAAPATAAGDARGAGARAHRDPALRERRAHALARPQLAGDDRGACAWRRPRARSCSRCRCSPASPSPRPACASRTGARW